LAQHSGRTGNLGFESALWEAAAVAADPSRDYFIADLASCNDAVEDLLEHQPGRLIGLFSGIGLGTKEH